GYFPAVTLNAGDSLVLTVEFSFAIDQPRGGSPFKYVLCNTNGQNPRTADGGPPTGGYQGYGSFTNAGDPTQNTHIRKRNGVAANRSTATLFEITDGDEIGR